MKRWLLVLVVVFTLILIATFISFPKEVTSSNIAKINCSINSVNRFVLKNDKWKDWWPGAIEHDSFSENSTFNYKGLKYKTTDVRYNAMTVQTIANGFTIDGTIFFVPLSIDSVQIEWVYSLKTNNNPINRILLHNETRKVNNNIKDVLQSLKLFLENPEKVYGMTIYHTKVTDTILVTTRFISPQFPATAIIYQKIDSLKKYISENNAIETNFPMVYIRQDSGIYKTTIGIPLNHAILENSKFLIKRMIPGNILVAQVKGGAYTANDAVQKMGMFMTDNRLTSPAIPFESLITNRMTEPDTTKWITKIYYPVF